MKKRLVWLSAMCIAGSLWAQAPAGGAYSPAQLDQLLGPIALYPDPLIALILPASTFPSEITLAANYLAANPNPSGIDAQPWDPSVKGLARYPTVVQWMSANLDWTQALGAAFAQQPGDVMKSIQQLRAQALAAGTLVNTPQQQVVMDGDDIRIVPAQQNTIYVPEYDPDLVYDAPAGYDGPFLTFGYGWPVGPWLGYECDWDDFGIWIGPWQPGWAYRRDWHEGGGFHAWHADPRRVAAFARNNYRPNGALPRPQAFGGAPRAAVRRAAAPRAAESYARPDYRGRVDAGERAPAPARPSGVFGGYSRGTETRAFSARGQASRAAPVRGGGGGGRAGGGRR